VRTGVLGVKPGGRYAVPVVHRHSRIDQRQRGFFCDSFDRRRRCYWIGKRRSLDHFGTMDAETGAVEAPTVTFTLTAAGDNFWTDAADVLTPTTNFGAAYSHALRPLRPRRTPGTTQPRLHQSAMASQGFSSSLACCLVQGS
jgi:hypothetical protein